MGPAYLHACCMASGALPWGSMHEEPPPDLDWSPLVPGGSVDRTHRVLAPKATRLELHPAVGILMLIGLSVALAAGGFSLMLWALVTIEEPIGKAMFGGLGLFMGLIFTVGAVVLRRRVDNRMFFDKELGHYGETRGADTVPLPSIRGLQLTPERVVETEGYHDVYELNLVLADGRRVNVLDHGDLANLHRDATRIAAFLGVPLWIEAGLTTEVRRL
jgi:hypothetical protein